MNDDDKQLGCILGRTLGRIERCPGPSCPFWEEEVEIGCVLDPIAADLLSLPVLSRHLLELRDRLQRVRDRQRAAAPESRFHRLLNEGGE